MSALHFPLTTDSNRPASWEGVQVKSIRDRGSEAILESRLRARTGVQAQYKGEVVIR